MAGRTLAHKLIDDHLVEGSTEEPGAEIALAIDQTLTQDATGTLVMLELEAMGLDRVRTELSAQYVDHNLIQADAKNPDDHLFLESACRRFGVWYSRPGNGVSHPVHMQRFGRPGATMVGSDSHTCAAGSLAMLAIGAGGLEVAAAMAGEPFYIPMPEVWGVRLTGELPDWVSAKDVVLEMLRRHDVDGGVGRIVEYHGPGVAALSAMDRHVIANMGMELGAVTTVFPSDDETRRFLASEGREDAWQALAADDDARYDVTEEIDLGALEPLIAKPSSPGNVVPVREVAGEPIYQAYIGSSANPGYRDFAVAARMVEGRTVPAGVSFDVNPTSRQLLLNLIEDGHMTRLVAAGARIHQAGCNGCIGMGQAPASGRNSLRTVPRNFPGRSGTEEDSVFLCSPETATASALAGVIADPRTMDMDCPRIEAAERQVIDRALLVAPPPAEEGRRVELVKSDNIGTLPEFDALPDTLELPVILEADDHISTDEILPAGTDILPLRSNIPAIAEFAFSAVDPDYPERAREVRDKGGHAVVGGRNYGQGSSREHAALAPRYLGLRAVVAESFARIHRQNLINFGAVPLRFAEPKDRDKVKKGATLRLQGLRKAVEDGEDVEAELDDGTTLRLVHGLDRRQRRTLLAGGLANLLKEQREAAA